MAVTAGSPTAVLRHGHTTPAGRTDEDSSGCPHVHAELELPFARFLWADVRLPGRK